ncbi:MAG: hypothetical protein EP318_00960 [Rhodobacteraceae bacterium]|nr:MAG: hypothetical protein EP318_00960 [Paracoccaceae bacterium]
MIDPADIQARKAALAQLMGEKLRVGGGSFEHKLKRAGRLLPRWARRDAARLIEAGQMAGNPRLARQIDVRALDAAQARLTRYLQALDLAERRKTLRINLAAGIAFKILLVAAVFILVARWQALL